MRKRWARHARFAAPRLERQRARARRWRRDLSDARAGLTALDRLPSLARLAGPDALLVFSVPLNDDSGTLVERHVSAVRVAPALLDHPGAIARIREVVSARLAARVCRLRRIRRVESEARIRIERALARDLTSTIRPADLQAGLFDHRSATIRERAEHDTGAVSTELEDQIRALMSLELVSVGEPRLILMARRMPNRPGSRLKRPTR